ncbi:MAG: biopolymer transporter ExbD [Candidatus Marinimicrobia bacterium]|nr:biopolymer transporter ExbD [Candidatus Neomarinimicrobiota bacterium]
MGLLKKKGIREVEIPSGSMADIAFLILIFFMVATTIDMDKGIQLILPAEGDVVEISKKNITNLIIDPKGRVLLDNKEIEINKIKPIIEGIILKNPKMIFSVKTHSRTKYQTYIEVLDQLKQTSAKVSIAE